MEASRKDLGQVFNHDVLSGAGGDASPGTRAKAAAAAIERSRHRSSTAEADPEYQERRKAEALAVHRVRMVVRPFTIASFAARVLCLVSSHVLLV